MSDRDKFLTESMGEKWHHCDRDNDFHCDDCRDNIPYSIDFSTWEGFGKLWGWSMKQEWWNTFWSAKYGGVIALPRMEVFAPLINPEKFATEIYEHLKSLYP